MINASNGGTCVEFERKKTTQPWFSKIARKYLTSFKTHLLNITFDNFSL